MKAAVEDVVQGKALKTAARDHGVNIMTLKRYVRIFLAGKPTEFRPNYVSKQVFTNADEDVIASYLLRASRLHYGLSTRTSRTLAFDYAQANAIPVPQNWDTRKCATTDWLRAFLVRRPELSLRSPEATSLGRAKAFNRHTVAQFFDNLREVRTRHQFPPLNIYNVDETDLTTVQKPVRVIAGRSEKQVGRITSAERGTLVTACCAVNALGSFVPPFFIFPRVRFYDTMLSGGPTGCDGAAQPTGWINADIRSVDETFC